MRTHDTPDSESDVERRTLDRVFAPLADAERRVLSRVDLPVGTSVVLLATKQRRPATWRLERL